MRTKRNVLVAKEGTKSNILVVGRRDKCIGSRRRGQKAMYWRRKKKTKSNVSAVRMRTNVLAAKEETKAMYWRWERVTKSNVLVMGRRDKKQCISGKNEDKKKYIGGEKEGQKAMYWQ